MIRNMFAVSAALLLALFCFASASQIAHADDPPCGYVQDCGFVNFYDPDGACSGAWKCFYASDFHPGIGLSDSEGGRTVPSVIFKSVNGAFDAGIYQQVPVTPGLGYRFNVLWAVERLDARAWQEGYEINRRVGIDPNGGTDPNSPAIKWSGDYFGSGKFVDEDLVVRAYAQSPTITVFVRIINPYADKVAEVYIDSASLIRDTDMQPIVVASPTLTAAPTLPPPTAKPTQPPKPTAEPTHEPAATDAPPTDEPAVKPTATVVKPTAPPHATRTRVAQVQPTARPARTRVANATGASSENSDSLQSYGVSLGTIGLIGLVGVSGAILLVSTAAFLLLRRK